MREQRHLETLSGRGWISLDGIRLGDVTYSIDVWQQFVSTADGGALPASRQAAGRVVDHSLHTSHLFDRVVRLHLEDGGHWDCFLEGDRLKAAGALVRAGAGAQ
jgi:hypothetical protein